MTVESLLYENESFLVAELRKMGAFFRRDLLVSWSYRMAFFADWVSLAAQILLFYFVGQLVDQNRLPVFNGARPTYVEFIAVSVPVASFLQIGLNRIVTAIRSEQLMGTLESLLMTPTSAMTLQLGGVVYDVVYVPIRTGVFLVLAWAILGAHFTFTGLGIATVLLIAFVPLVWGFGVISAAAVLTYRRGVGVVGFGALALIATSNVYFPLSVLPSWLRAVGEYNPITIAVTAMRNALLGAAGWGDIVLPIAELIPFSVVALAVGGVAFKLALQREKRRGTLGLY